MVLLWLLPSVVVTVAAMLWVAWAGREGRGVVDREVALRRMARVLDPPARTGRAARLVPPRLRRTRPAPSYAARAPRERSTGLAVRPSRSTARTTPMGTPTAPLAPPTPAAPPAPSADRPRRQAS